MMLGPSRTQSAPRGVSAVPAGATGRRSLPLNVSGSVAVDPCEAAALLVLQTQFQWKDTRNQWSNGVPCIQWTGVTCNSNGNVVSLDLTSLLLFGYLPPTMGKLQFLTFLSLVDNLFYGVIPASISKLSKLTYLNLLQNSLDGGIPTSLGGLLSLKYLHLGYNYLRGAIPSSLGRLRDLTYLSLYGNSLEGTIPPSLGLLTKLKELRIGMNHFNCSIPPSFKNLRGLRHLGLELNPLTGTIPSVIGNLLSLTNLVLGRTSVGGSIPRQLGKLTNLQHLYLYSNQLSGSLPLELGNMISLRYMHLQYNSISGPLPSTFRYLTNLRVLVMFSNQLNGTIPRSIGNMKSLQDLHLQYNSISGPLPSTFRYLTNLRVLRMFSNQLNGTIPRSMGNMKSLQDLNLFSNSFEGSIPSELGRLLNLTRLSLMYSPVGGTIPSALGRLSRLQSLYLCSTNIYGSLPSTLGNLQNLQYLTLQYAYGLNGTLPASFGRLRSLGTLNLSWTGLSGSLPATLSGLTSLQGLFIPGNKLTGTIPCTLGRLSNLVTLDLNRNHLEGSIPRQLGRLTNLQNLYLYGNQLSGALPQELGNMSSLSNMYLHYNRLNGTLPSTFQNLTNLKELYLYTNSLEGTLPEFFGHLTNLKILIMCTNKLNGTIPGYMGNMKSLQDLNLFSNSFKGSIPSELGRLLNLTRLSLMYSPISGTIPSALGRLSQLKSLYLSSTKINGSLPSALGNLQNLQYFTLQYVTGMSGTLPASFGKLQSLTSLKISWTKLSGSLPAALSGLTSLRELLLPGNKLTGTIPSYLGRLRNLATLHLQDNQLYGSVPSAVWEMQSLSRLILDDNQLTGSLPLPLLRTRVTRSKPGDDQHQPRSSISENSAATTSQTISLSGNYFTGPCPAGQPTVSSFQQSCFSPEGSCAQNQRTREACAQFCNTTAQESACGGLGLCFLDPISGNPTCLCLRGLVRDPLNPGACIVPDPVPSPPPGPPPGNYTQGVAFSVPITQPSLNRWSRYLSLHSFVSNGVPNWNIMAASTWAAPGDLFLSYSSALLTNRTAVLTWQYVRDQGGCAACWATATVDAISAAVAISASKGGGTVRALSAPQLLSCVNGSRGCQGNFPTNALEFAATSGLAFNDSLGPGDQCSGTEAPPPILMYEAVQFRGWFGLLLTLQAQPALVLLQGSSLSFQRATCQITNFVFNNAACYSGSLDHTVVVLGYDLTALQPYWLLRNSWGRDWCLGGYMRLAIQGGAGVCGMNVLPAYYPIAAPQSGDPCYTRSTVPSGSPGKAPALNPCGSGSCSPRPDWGPYSYACDCSDLGNFVAVNNSVPVAQPGAQLGITQTCAPVDACSLSLSNPCVVGTCVNDNLGGYSCICPLGYFQNTFTDGRPTCTYASNQNASSASYKVEPLVTCRAIRATYNLTLDQLFAQNPDLDCSTLSPGTVLDVSNSFFQCNVAYTATDEDNTCADVASRLPLWNSSNACSQFPCAPSATALSASDVQRLNPELDCSGIPKGQLVCLATGAWAPPQVCTQSVALTAQQDCSYLLRRYFPQNPLGFFAANPGIDCTRLANPGGALSAIGASGATVCLATRPVGTLNCLIAALPPKYPKYSLKPYALKRGDTCTTVAGKLKFRSAAEVQSLNNRLSGFTCPGVVGAIVCCPR